MTVLSLAAEVLGFNAAAFSGRRVRGFCIIMISHLICKSESFQMEKLARFEGVFILTRLWCSLKTSSLMFKGLNSSSSFLSRQVCAILQRPLVRPHQDQQQASVPAPRHDARHTQLRVQRRRVLTAKSSKRAKTLFVLCFKNLIFSLFPLTGCRPFLKIYQAMQPVYTSGI